MFTVILEVFKDLRSYVWPLTVRANALRALGIIVLLLIAVMVTNDREAEPVSNEVAVQTVTLTSAAEMATESGFEYVAEVLAVDEVVLQAEAGGRITAVYSAVGERVGAGAVLATIENDAARAALLQAQGAYDAAVASAAVSEQGVVGATAARERALNTAVATYNSAFSTAEEVTLTTIDQFFSDPRGMVPGVLIDSQGQTAYLNDARRQLEQSLTDWKATIGSPLSSTAEVTAALNNAEATLTELRTLTSTLVNLTNTADAQDTLYGATVQSYTSTVLAAQRTLSATIASVRDAAAALASAESALAQAKLQSSTGSVSVAEATVTQARGALLAAQARFEDTIVRTPISGTVNELSVRVGDYVSNGARIGEVANNGSLTLRMYVGAHEIANLAIGDAVALPAGATGTIASIAPAVNPTTNKAEVTIATEATNLTNGDTVSVRLLNTTSVVATGPIFIPLTAVKFTATDAAVYSVVDSKLVAVPVATGVVLGGEIEITGGLTRNDMFVLDARGLAAGQTVTEL